MCGCTHDFPLEISVSPSPLRLLECQNLVVTLHLSCLQTVKVNTENSEEEEYVPQERQPSEANKNNGCEHAESLARRDTALACMMASCCTRSQICDDDDGSRIDLLPLKR